MRTSFRSIGDLLFGQTRGKVLALLFGSPDALFYLREIARQVETSVGNVQRELTLLVDVGLVIRTERGNQVYFQANQMHPDFPELRALLAKTMGVFQMLTAALYPLSSHIQIAFVYGSVARDESNANSDVDLMLIGELSLDEVLDALAKTERYLRRPINPTIYTLADLLKRLHEGNHFLQSLTNSKKVFLIGDENDFRAACTNRLVQD
jgi:predicted nucleotidyltransferase